MGPDANDLWRLREPGEGVGRNSFRKCRAAELSSH
jgi:hypothetical protein